jgi:hypothetical protein
MFRRLARLADVPRILGFSGIGRGAGIPGVAAGRSKGGFVSHGLAGSNAASFPQLTQAPPAEICMFNALGVFAAFWSVDRSVAQNSLLEIDQFGPNPDLRCLCTPLLPDSSPGGRPPRRRPDRG